MEVHKKINDCKVSLNEAEDNTLHLALMKLEKAAATAGGWETSITDTAINELQQKVLIK
jgi:hypothetical protein